MASQSFLNPDLSSVKVPSIKGINPAVANTTDALKGPKFSKVLSKDNAPVPLTSNLANRAHDDSKRLTGKDELRAMVDESDEDYDSMDSPGEPDE